MPKLLLILLIVFSYCVQAIGQDGHAYVGVNKCKMCHKGEKKGMMFEIWSESAHAKAFAALAEQPAKDVYAKLGKEGNPQEDPACLKCHVTGYGAVDTLAVKLVRENGVTCESCHGAGGDYFKMPVMKDRAKAIAGGMVEKPGEGCVSCHNEESPTFKEFKFDEMWPKIKHMRPTKEG